MYEITAQQAIFYLLVWLISFLAAIARTLRDGQHVSIGHSVSLGFTAGLLSFGAIAFLVSVTGGDSVNPWRYLGGSALIGLFAKEQDKLGKFVLARMFASAKVFFLEGTEDRDAGKNEDRDSNG